MPVMIERKNPIPEKPPISTPETTKSVELPRPPESPKERAVESAIPVKPIPTTTSESSVISPQSQSIKRIESILEEGLGELYAGMTPERQVEFKRVGEETASKIASLLLEAKVHVKKIIDLIRNWLKLIPGVNKYFLEQEAKIKADKIIAEKGE